MVQEFGSTARLAEGDAPHVLPKRVGRWHGGIGAQAQEKDVWSAVGKKRWRLRNFMQFPVACILTLFIVCCFISWGCPATSRQSLQKSALRALEGSIRDFIAPSPLDADDDEGPNLGGSARQRASAPAASFTTKNLTDKRARVTPYQAKRVAAAQAWRCGCGCVDPRDPDRRGFLLNSTFEIDHRTPTRFGGAHDASNWVAVLRSHHQMKSALESQAASMRKR